MAAGISSYLCGGWWDEGGWGGWVVWSEESDEERGRRGGGAKTSPLGAYLVVTTCRPGMDAAMASFPPAWSQCLCVHRSCVWGMGALDGVEDWNEGSIIRWIRRKRDPRLPVSSIDPHAPWRC